MIKTLLQQLVGMISAICSTKFSVPFKVYLNMITERFKTTQSFSSEKLVFEYISVPHPFINGIIQIGACNPCEPIFLEQRLDVNKDRPLIFFIIIIL